jgi:GAF domain-containing protein
MTRTPATPICGATDGSISARFQSLRLPMGTGLGGLVAQTGAPYVTADYASDPRFRHTGEINQGVQEEGLVAILGVPMRLGPKVVGVLFAANRSARPFAPEEVSLLRAAPHRRRHPGQARPG